jgi:hypothetical protein
VASPAGDLVTLAIGGAVTLSAIALFAGVILIARRRQSGA